MNSFDFDASHCEAAEKDKQHKWEEQTPFHDLNLVSLPEEEYRCFDVAARDELCPQALINCLLLSRKRAEPGKSKVVKIR